MAYGALHCVGTRGGLRGRVSGDYFATITFTKDFQGNSEQLNKVNTVTEACGAMHWPYCSPVTLLPDHVALMKKTFCTREVVNVTSSVIRPNRGSTAKTNVLGCQR
jgi:hypothetical protein